MENLQRHYKLLAIEPGASLEQVRKAYAAAESGLHADRLADDPHLRRRAQERLSAINEAYLAITDSLAIKESHGEVPVSAGDQRSQLLPLPTAGPEPVTEGVSAAESTSGGMPAPGTAADQIGSGENTAPEPAANGDSPATPPLDPDEEGLPDPAGELKRDIFLLFAALAAVLAVLLLIRCGSGREGPAPAAKTGNATPAEMAQDAPPVMAPGTTTPDTAGRRGGKAGRSESPAAREESSEVTAVRQAAELGNVKAQTLLGYWHASGVGAAKNFAEAARWFRRAAEQGGVEARNWLGYLYVWRPRFPWTRDCVKSSDQGERIWKRMEAALVQRRESVARPELHQKSNVGVPTARKKQYFVSCGVNLSML